MAFCPNCGQQVAEGVAFCPSCGNPINVIPNSYQQQPYAQQAYQQPSAAYQPNYAAAPGYQGQPPMPSSNMVWAILTTLFCCLPFGIVSIVYAAKVSGLYAAGQYNLALDASKKAGQWAMWSAISGFIIIAIYIIAIIATGGALLRELS